VALVVKHSDNIFKGFATSASVVISCVVHSYLFEDTTLNETFGRGSFVVLVSSAAYALITTHRQRARNSIASKLASSGGTAICLDGGGGAINISDTHFLSSVESARSEVHVSSCTSTSTSMQRLEGPFP
jgi:Nucleotide-sugar transporter